MSKQDVLDQELARQFAWRAVSAAELSGLGKEAQAPPPSPPPTPPSPPPPDEAVAAAEQERWERAAEDCAALAEAVERAWLMEPAQQAAATAKLLDRARRLGFDLMGMGDHPRASARLWRLVVRHYDALPAATRRGGVHALSFAAPPPDEREVVDLLVEAAELGDSWLNFMMERGPACEETARRHPALGARLARVLDAGKTWAARETAARWLSFAVLREALPALRRALRRPHARIRWIALEILLERAPQALSADDVQWLLEDAVVHPLPGGYGTRAHETIEGYADSLLAAVAKVRPPEGWRPLTRIADGRGVHIRKERAGIDAGWALRALAAGYPERALARVDRELAEVRGWRKMDAVEAAGHLPDEHARPRLLEAAMSPAHRIAERARKLWFERFGGECPVERLAGVPVRLLAAPPGERLLARLTVLRGASDEAKGAMLEALLAELPPAPAEGEETPAPGADQREALALILYALREGSLPYRRDMIRAQRGLDPRAAAERNERGADLPSSEEKWAELLLRRCGEPAWDGLAELAARDARTGVDHGWLSAFASLVRRDVLRPAWIDELRRIAVEGLRSPGWGGSTAPLVVLTQVGPPPELIDLLWPIAMEIPGEDALLRRHYTPGWAADALTSMQAAPALDARILAGAEEALAARDVKRLERILRMGCRRKLPGALELSARCLALAGEDPVFLGVATQSAYALREAGRLDEGWPLEALGRPESPRFAIATHMIGKDPPPAVLHALERALGGDARGGAAAAEAARVLVWRKIIALDDPRMGGILERAPAPARAELLGSLLLLEAPLEPLRRFYLDLLTGPDKAAAAEAFEQLYGRQPEGTWELFEEARPRCPHTDVREAMSRYLGEPSEPELYWRHADDEEDDEDLDELLEDDEIE